MEKRLILFFALSIVILFGWQAFFSPVPPAQPPQQAEQAEQAAEGPAAPAATEERPRPAESGAASVTETADETDPAYAAVAAVAATTLTLETDLHQVEFGNDGGRILSWRLLEYETAAGAPLNLLPRYENPPSFPLAVDLDDRGLADYVNRALYEMQRQSLDSETERIVFRWSDGKGIAVEKSLTFHRGDYLVDVGLSVTDRGRPLAARLTLGPGFGAQDAGGGKSNYHYAGQVVWNRGGSVTRRKARKVDAARVSGDYRWAGIEDQYFAALWIPETVTSELEIRSSELMPILPPPVAGEEAAEPEAKKAALVSVSIPAEGAKLYVGPKQYTSLRDRGHELSKVVWFSSNGFLYAIAKTIFLALVWIHDHTLPNYGVAIILTTFLLRVLLFPLNQWSMVKIKRSQTEMQKVQPKVNALRKKYKGVKDPQQRAKMNQEMMDLYRKEGVNPMGGITGCLPMLAQFPILIGFFNMLTVAIELRGAPFLGWISDLASPDPLWITPLVMGGTMFLQQKLAMTKVTDPMQRQQQRIMMIMPVMFTVLCISMPSGLVLYWLTNNVLGIGQQWLVNRTADAKQAEAEAAALQAKKAKKAAQKAQKAKS